MSSATSAPCGAAVEVGLVDDEEEALVRVLLQPLARAIEDGPLERAHQHVLEHRVVRDEDVGRRLVDLVPREEFRVVRERHAALEVAVLVVPAAFLPYQAARSGFAGHLPRFFSSSTRLAGCHLLRRRRPRGDARERLT